MARCSSVEIGLPRPEDAKPQGAGAGLYLEGYSGPGHLLNYAHISITGLESTTARITVDAYPGDAPLYVVVDPLGASVGNPYIADPRPLTAWRRLTCSTRTPR